MVFAPGLLLEAVHVAAKEPVAATLITLHFRPAALAFMFCLFIFLDVLVITQRRQAATQTGERIGRGFF